MPSLDEQKRLVAELRDISAEIERLEGLYRRKLSALSDLRKSLLHQAFSGEL